VRPAPLTVEISAVEYKQVLREKGVEGFAVFVYEILAEFKLEEITSKVRVLLDEFKDWFPDPKPGVKFANLSPNSAPNRGEFNHPIPLIDPGIRPYYQHSRPISQAELEILKERIRDLIELGHIRPSTSP
jgi:hypothetical protein